MSRAAGDAPSPDGGPAGPPGPRRRRPVRGGLATRVVAACLVVAVAAVAVAALVAVRLTALTAQDVTRDLLARQADVLAAQLAEPGGRLGVRRVAEVLRGQGIDVVLLGEQGTLLATGAAAEAVRRTGAHRRIPDGVAVSGVAPVGDADLLVEARPVPGGGFALVAEVGLADVPAPVLQRNLGFALLAGTAAALVVGLFAGRLLARPLRATAAAARTLRTGRRDVRVPVTGPAESAELAGAVNELADALARSEDRQRAFLLSVSHELRTPLTAVTGFAESLADGVVTGADVPRVGGVVLGEAHRLDRLVTDLVELARLEADEFRLEPGPLELGALVAGAAEVWAVRCAAAGVVFRAERPPHPVPVRADPRRLRQVLDGLAENALRVTPAGAALVLAAARAGPGALLEVRDGGPGLTPEDAAAAFEPGVLHGRYRDRRPAGIGGVGLALVHGLVVRMGGTITVDRAPEGGARFRVRLPAS